MTLLGLVVRPFGATASSDPLQSRQWGLSMVKAGNAWKAATGAGVVIAIVDSGVDADHPELKDKLVGGVSFVCDAGVPRPCADFDDNTGHGTHMAGIAAAPHDGVGVVGVAPDAQIMPVKVTGADGQSTDKNTADGIRWAVDHGADVINLSVSGLPFVGSVYSATKTDSQVADAMQYALDNDVLVVYSAGNESAPICDEHALGTAEDALCVGAIDRRKAHAVYSNVGLGLDVVAPGGAGTGAAYCEDAVEDILSTWSTAHDNTACPDAVGYKTRSGTSMAAPFVTGIAALLAELDIRGKAAADKIKASAADLGVPGADSVYGSGLVDAAKAVGASNKPVVTTTTSSTSTTSTTETTMPSRNNGGGSSSGSTSGG